MIFDRSRGALLSRIRYQAPVTALLIAAQAALIPTLWKSGFLSNEIILSTAIFCMLATFCSLVLNKNLGRYPGVEEATSLFLSLTVCYGTLVAILLMLRVPYSRSLIASTFFVNAVALTVLYAGLRKWTRLTIGVVPVGRYRELTRIHDVNWVVLGKPDTQLKRVDAISGDLWADLPDQWERRLADFALEGIPVYDIKHLQESLTGKVQIEHLSENTFGTLSPLHAWMGVKYVFDWILALIALILLLPLFLVLATAIRFESPGPAIFRQIRIGYRGRPFKVYKFRTMTDDNGRVDSPPAGRLEDVITKDGDDRITRIGRVLRRSRLDELPQLINVLKGEMSWIGPRPEAIALSEWYEREIPFYRYRHIVRPGITGWAQVHQGHVAEVDQVHEKLHYDFYYIKNFSLWADLIIVGRTIKTMLTGFGAR